jgi:VIT1/CCC1 family predicted Fe2+/Mn2+ transporter
VAEKHAIFWRQKLAEAGATIARTRPGWRTRLRWQWANGSPSKAPELGINPDNLGGSAFAAAPSSFVVFALGAIIPVTPFFVISGTIAVVASVASSAAALFAIGAIVTIFTSKGAVVSGARQTAIGLAAAVLTYGLGRVLGVAVSG